MTDPADVALLCENLSILERVAPDEARHLVAEVCRGADISEPLATLLRTHDIPVGVTTDRGAPGPLFPTSGRATREVLVCPRDVCNRVAARRPGTPTPTCRLHGSPFKTVRL